MLNSLQSAICVHWSATERQPYLYAPGMFFEMRKAQPMPRHHRKRAAKPIISLFSGAGGLDCGFAAAGFKPILAIDNDPAACHTYHRNNPATRVVRKDLAGLSPNYILDRLSEEPYPVKPVGVIGGPPCQPFSISNVHKRTDDPRSRLPESYAGILRALNKEFELDFFVFENVAGLALPRHEPLLKHFKKLFSRAGFHVFQDSLDARDFGVPQRRKRIFIVGINKTKYPDVQFAFPLGGFRTWRTVRDAIGGLPPPTFYRRDLTRDDIPFHPNHWCMVPRSKKFSNGFLKIRDLSRRPFRVLEWDKPSGTVAYGNREVHVHPSGGRRLSVYEAMRLQAFPARYELWGSLSDQIRLVSDAVPPPLAKALAVQIRKTIDRSDARRTSRVRQTKQIT